MPLELPWVHWGRLLSLLTTLGSAYVTLLFEKNKKNPRKGKSCSPSTHLKLSLDTSFSLSPLLKRAHRIAPSTADQNLKQAGINVVICLNCPLDVLVLETDQTCFHPMRLHRALLLWSAGFRWMCSLSTARNVCRTVCLCLYVKTHL